MPIKIPNALPATKTLQDENIFVMDETRALSQDIRPLKIGLLNLMPDKIKTETQFARVLSNTPLQIELTLVAPQSHLPKNTPQEHMLSFYQTFDEIRDQHFDGFIISGAPVEHLAFEDVGYWDELCTIMDWTCSNVHSTLHICWGAQAALYHHYGIPKRDLDFKYFGLFHHRVEDPQVMLMRGFDEWFWVPQSRHTTNDRADIEACPDLKVLASSPNTGVYAIKTDEGRQIFLTGHLEYDANTLKEEYERDIAAGECLQVPSNYFPDDDPSAEPIMNWRANAHLLYANWLNYYVYQTVPYKND